jgi:hypothetical protein
LRTPEHLSGPTYSPNVLFQEEDQDYLRCPHSQGIGCSWQGLNSVFILFFILVVAVAAEDNVANVLSAGLSL